ncbi:putative protein N(5)-glutamine methyltransferase [Streptomyces spongiicola]|uniref:peptide chain release factor N(5)-glutamine methyltransferase n=1 Tax=Streptomyces spongiicola TaxID=1690221 RepID=A0A388T536_9ACTN|nr:putative protein N(5)-glutamine methyltransferase [Streptomyces spongiicola]GBQ04057.1 putative protein N(5)-glutamine methyltransferase [Streptomyces spongiicola]
MSYSFDPSPSSPSPSPSVSRPAAADVVGRLRAAGCVFAEDEARLLFSAARTPDELTALVERRACGHPLEHILGWAEFCGLRIAVEPGVFVPRRRTEFLVSRAVHTRPDADVVVDLCCGSGAVGAALAASLPGRGTELYASDIEPAAVRCARRNLPEGARVFQGDLFEPLPGLLRGRVDILAANVPYVPTEEVGLLPAEARMHEPLVALDGGTDGLDVLRRVTAKAGEWLAPGGILLFETSEHQAAGALAAVAEGGLEPAAAICDERYATVVVGMKTAC